jgi:hypothetical protein
LEADLITSASGSDGASPPSSSQEARRISVREIGAHLLFIALVLGTPFGLAISGKAFRDGDVSWQIATGQWILAHAAIPAFDPFSFTAAGHPWVAMEWLSEIVFAAGFRLAGYGGVAAVVAAASIALSALVFFYLQRRGPLLVACAALLMMDVVLAPFVLARPHVLAWPLLAAWTIVLLRAAEAGRPPALWWTLILVVWTNTHASFPLALPIAAAIAFDSVVAERWTNLRQWLIFGVVSVAALMCNANGIAGLLQPFRTTSLAMLPYIGEWHPSSIGNTPEFFWVLLLSLAAVLWTGVRVPLGRLLLLMILLGLAFAHVRHQSTFVIVAALIVPPLLNSKPSTLDVPKWLLAGCVPLLAYPCLVQVTPPESPAHPRHLIAAIPEALRSQPVFNEYTFGGPLILAGIKPYIDGRAEIYGDDFVIDYMDIIDGDMPRLNRAVQRYGIRWAMLPVGRKRLIEGLESSGEWRRIYADRIGVIEVRVAGTPIQRCALQPLRAAAPRPASCNPPRATQSR